MALAVTLCLLVVATVFDRRAREIPDWVSGALLVCGLFAGWMQWQPMFGLATIDLTSRLIATGIGFVIGAFAFYLAAFGGADAKIATGLGASLGVWPLLVVLFWSALAGAGLAVYAQRKGEEEFAYAPAFLTGLVAAQVYFLL